VPSATWIGGKTLDAICVEVGQHGLDKMRLDLVYLKILYNACPYQLLSHTARRQERHKKWYEPLFRRLVYIVTSVG
jgi:hypothetical protein